VEGNLDTPLLCNSNEEIASDPELISHGNALARANLELPLRRHNFGIDAADPDASIKTGTIVGFDQIAGNDPSGTSTTVIRSLRARETTFGPAVRPIVDIEKGVLLLETEPGNMILC
jgi:hypothetical protein